VEPKELKTEEFKANIEAMWAILKEDGLGLAATQANWPVRLFLLCQDENFNSIDPKAFINPVITSHSSKLVKEEEGCLSFPGFYTKVSRPETIEWEYMDIEGVRHSVKSNGYYARAIMHEIDHLDGKLFIDRLSTAHKSKYNKWLRLQT